MKVGYFQTDDGKPHKLDEQLKELYMLNSEIEETIKRIFKDDKIMQDIWIETLEYPWHIIVGGQCYAICDENTKGNRGFGGAKFKFEILKDTEMYNKGDIVETTNLFHNGELPDELKKIINDTAKCTEDSPTKLRNLRKENTIDPITIPNVCFTIKPNEEKYVKQRIENGFDESETWNLDRTVVLFVTPRLKILANRMMTNKEYPDYWYKSYEDWETDLKFVLDNFEKMVKRIEKGMYPFFSSRNRKDDETFRKTFETFGKILPHLWD